MVKKGEVRKVELEDGKREVEDVEEGVVKDYDESVKKLEKEEKVRMLEVMGEDVKYKEG